MKRIPVILDGDPGHDDAIAWMIAAASPMLDVKAVTTVAGNKDIDHVTDNAAKLCELFKINAPLSKGAKGPLVVEGITAGEFHGKTGLDGVDLPFNGVKLSNFSAVELMVNVLENSDEPVVIIGTGAETNLATLLLYRPDLKTKIRAFYIMGGGIENGNWNPAAEFNILVDPEAAKIVFESGIPIVMNGLDVTEKALIYPNEIEEIRKIGTPLSYIVGCWLDFFGKTHEAMGYTGWPLHDPCAVLSLTNPEMFTMKDAFIQVDTTGVFTRGATLADYLDKEHFNGKVVTGVNRKFFVEKIKETIESYGKACGQADYKKNTIQDSGYINKIPDDSVTSNILAVSPSDTPDMIRSKVLQNVPCCLVLLGGVNSVALAFKVWPGLSLYINKIIYAGGTLGPGDATVWAEESVFKSPEGVESLLNTGVPVIFVTLEAAHTHRTNVKAMANDYAEHSNQYKTVHCGVHVEFHSNSPAVGKLVCDLKSDHKFKNKNAYLVI